MGLPFPDSMDSGAWPFLAGGLPCQVGSGNERDLYLLIRMFNQVFCSIAFQREYCLEALEDKGHNRSVMPFNVLGSTRATLMYVKSLPNTKVIGKSVVFIVIGIDP